MLTLRDTPDQAQIRVEMRTWIDAHLPDELRWVTDFEQRLELDRLLARHDLLAPGWPTAFGGRGLVPDLEFVVNQELESAGVQRATSPSHQGVNNFAPALMVHGTDVQKSRCLPAILAVEELWCQGFSEPDAGSDLASVRTTAVEHDDCFVVNGSKIWTSGAEEADFIYLLVRTGSVQERHRGLSFLYAPMSTPGLSTRPIEQMTGGSDFSEVHLADVRVPRANLVGSVGDGWKVAMTLLSSERLSGRHRYGLFRRELVELARVLDPGADGTADIRSDALGQFGRVIAEVEGMGALARRIESLRAAAVDVGSLPSVNKLWWPAAHQRLSEVGLKHAGADLSVWFERWLAARPESIYGGTAQIQRNIIAERFLGLPR